MRYKKPDRKNAQIIIDAATKDMKYTLTIEPTKESGSTIIRNIYECFRMLGDALLTSKGIESEDNFTPMQELLKVKVTTDRPINLISNLRRLRHNINYYGYIPSLDEVLDVIDIAKNTFEPLLKEIMKQILKP
ncbi:MAG: hypothetical protein KKF44_10105 [Nanoarchaeota archaeon]|nr:hypothetical protein [Nanoarchaeota archaeon]